MRDRGDTQEHFRETLRSLVLLPPPMLGGSPVSDGPRGPRRAATMRPRTLQARPAGDRSPCIRISSRSAFGLPRSYPAIAVKGLSGAHRVRGQGMEEAVAESRHEADHEHRPEPPDPAIRVAKPSMPAPARIRGRRGSPGDPIEDRVDDVRARRVSGGGLRGRGASPGGARRGGASGGPRRHGWRRARGRAGRHPGSCSPIVRRAGR
jgi:hypothetical protein